MNGVFLEDGGSTNGTTLNGERIERRCEVVPGDRVGIGADILELCLRSEGEETEIEAVAPDSEELTHSVRTVRMASLVPALLEECLHEGRVPDVLPQLRVTVDRHIEAWGPGADAADEERDELRRLIDSFRMRVMEPDFQVWSESVVSRLS